MNKNKKLLCVLLSVLFLTAPLGIAAFSMPGSTTAANSAIPAAEYDFGNRRSPINILIYNEYSDLNAGGEWENTLSAILEVYGPEFQYTNLTDYTQLGSMLVGFDVFLIPEQETASIAQSETIGTAWAGILADYVNAGGILISLDGGTAVSQTGAKILNATNLLKTYNEQLVNSLGIGVVNTTNALAFGVSSSFTAPNAMIAVDVDDGDIVFEHSTSHKAVVVHKMMGQGHIVLIGTDFNTPDVNVKDLLANAIRLTRLAVFDNTHNQQTTPLLQLDLLGGKLVEHGFAIATMDNWDDSLVQHSDVFVVPNTSSTPLPFSIDELDSLEEVVSSGSGLWIMTDYWNFGNTTDGLLQRFGYERNYSGNYFADTDDNDGNPFQPTFGSGNIANHSATVGVSGFKMFGGTAFEVIPQGATPLIWADSDGTAIWGSGPTEASGLAIAAASHYGAGRVVAISDGDWAHSSYITNLDNIEFAASVAIWLSSAGLPEKTMLFEQTHSPFSVITSAGMWETARFFTFNGFNIRWENHFSEELISESDIVVIFNGGQNYTGPEKDYLREYVAGGGSLFLLCDWSTYNIATNDLIAEFGMEVNGTSFLADTDDGYIDTAPSSYLHYEEGNFANHPIMNGVTRIEIDRGCGFSNTGGGVPLVFTDDDGTSLWRNQTSTNNGAADAVPVIVATEFAFGRIVVLPDINFIGTGDPDGDSYPQLYDAENDVFLANTMYWLVENRAPTVEVVFPNGGEVLDGIQIVEWTAVDFDSDPLTFDVYYSDNNGSDWSLLASGLTVLQYEWNTTQHDDGDTYMILVEVTDGMLGNQDVSDAPFELDNFVGGGPGFTLDPMLLIIIGAGVLVVIILVVIIMKKKGGE
ncbi:MAG: hypothetical protein ACFFES_10750 [Candidatus Thorarchaeota archaeon]